MAEFNFHEDYAKKYLVPGNLVRLKNGDLRLVVITRDGLALIGRHGESINARNYDCNLDRMYSLDGDSKNIDRVYGRPGMRASAKLIDTPFALLDRKLLWEREEVKEMTVAEIEEALGYKVKIIEE